MVYLIHRLTNLLFLVFHYYTIMLTLIDQSFVIFIWEICIFFKININSFIIYLVGTNLNSSIICFLSSGDIYLFLGVSISISFFISSLSLHNSLEVFFFECNSVETPVILSAILLPIKSPVASAVFWIALFEAVFIASVVDF